MLIIYYVANLTSYPGKQIPFSSRPQLVPVGTPDGHDRRNHGPRPDTCGIHNLFRVFSAPVHGLILVRDWGLHLPDQINRVMVTIGLSCIQSGLQVVWNTRVPGYCYSE